MAFSFGDSTFDSYYSSALKALPNQQISYTPVSIEEQTVDSITDQVSSYLRNYYDDNIKSRQAQTVSDLAGVDVDAASRGMTQSTYLDDLKTRYRASEAADIASINNNYNSQLAQTVQAQYNDYLARKLSVDQFNTSNQVDVDKWNAQARYALEELAFNRANAAYQLAQSHRGGGSRDDSGMQEYQNGDESYYAKDGHVNYQVYKDGKWYDKGRKFNDDKSYNGANNAVVGSGGLWRAK